MNSKRCSIFVRSGCFRRQKIKEFFWHFVRPTGLFLEFKPISLVHRLCYSLKCRVLPCGSDDFVNVDCLWSRCFGDKFFCYFFLSAGRLGVWCFSRGVLNCDMQPSLDTAASVTTIFQVVPMSLPLGYCIRELAACDL